MQNPNGLEGIWNIAQQLGLPSPQVIVAELQRLNANLEAMHPSIQSLAQGMENFTPQEVNRLVEALNRASASGDQLYKQLWGGQGR